MTGLNYYFNSWSKVLCIRKTKQQEKKNQLTFFSIIKNIFRNESKFSLDILTIFCFINLLKKTSLGQTYVRIYPVLGSLRKIRSFE
jgi:hypothetical protein